VSEEIGSWSSRDLNVLGSLTAGKTEAWEASVELDREGTGVAGGTWVAKETGSTFLFCSKESYLFSLKWEQSNNFNQTDCVFPIKSC